MANTPSVVIFGAGNIGRGLIGELAAASGRRLGFVEAWPDLVRSLRRARAYQVVLTGAERSTLQVSGFDVFTTAEVGRIETTLTKAEFAATAVGGAHLGAVAELLAPALAKRREILNILVCENLHHADQVLEKALIAQGAAASSFAAVRCSVEPMMRGTDGSLDVLGESIRTVYAHRPAWRGAPPEIRGIEFRGNVDAFYARKLYTNNAGHALLAYLGALEGCELICEAIEIPAVRRPLGDLLDVAAEALAREFELDRNALAHHVESLLTVRYANRDLADPVRRVAREPLRKLGPGDRLVGLVRLLQGNGLPTRPVAPAIAGALLYEDPDDADSVKVKQMRAELGTEATLCSICGFQTDEPPVAEVLEALEALEG